MKVALNSPFPHSTSMLGINQIRQTSGWLAIPFAKIFNSAFSIVKGQKYLSHPRHFILTLQLDDTPDEALEYILIL